MAEEAIFPTGSVIATMRAWGVPIDDPGVQLRPTLCAFALLVDGELDVFETERRQRLGRIAAEQCQLCFRDAAFLKGAFWEAVVVAVAERPGRSQ